MADEVQGTPLVTQEEIDNQPTEDDLKLPTNEEVIASGENTDPKAEAPAGAEDGAGGSDDAAQVAETPQEAPVEYETVDDPGEFASGDYSFEVTVYDEEGKAPKLHKVTSLEQWDQLLETEPNFGSSAAVLRAERNAQKMDRGLERDKAEYDRRKTEYDDAVKQQEARDATTQQWQNELDYLVNKGELPPMPAEFHVAKANWSDPNIAKQPAVKAQMDLLAYFRAENASRTKLGLAPMTSLLDAYQGYAREQEKQANSSAKQQQNDARRAQAGRVASSSPKPATAAPKGIAIGRTGVLG